MGILEIIKNRRSIRKFQSKSIPENLIGKMITALIWAPSAHNLQSRKFYFVFKKEIKARLAEAAFNQNFINQAPLVVVGCQDLKKVEYYKERGKNLYSVCDVATSIQNLMLWAKEEGLGTCWVGKFDEKEVSKILGLAENLRPVVIVPVGYPAEKPEVPARLSKDELIKFIK